EFQYVLNRDPDASELPLIYGEAFENGGHQGLSADGGTMIVTEGNAVWHCQAGGPYHDSYGAKDSFIRNNYYFDVLVGPFQNFFGGVNMATQPIPFTLTNSGTTYTATTSFPHGFRAADASDPEHVILADILIIPGIGQVSISA